MVETRAQQQRKSSNTTDPSTDSSRCPPAAQAKAPVGMLGALGPLLLAMAKRTFGTIFVMNMSQNINRTAVMMLVFLVVHMLGNLSFFGGAEAFNMYGHLLHINPALKLVEGYLLLTLVLHIVIGVHLSVKLGRLGSLKAGALAITGAMVLVFIVLHLRAFKFGPEYSVTYGETTMRDLYRLELEFFASPVQVVWYTVAVSALGFHLWKGWTKTVYKLGLDSAYIQPARALGHLLIIPLTVGFVSTPIYAFLAKPS